jgi:hypothetical protein
MRRISFAALLAVPLLLLAGSGKASANPNSCSHGFGCGGFCFQLFQGLHQHGPLFNYGPYYGYYPFKPYGPWDEYLRYDPFFYGDPYANWQGKDAGGNYYGRNTHLPQVNFPHLHRLWHGGLFHHNLGSNSSGFWHASWLHGGWFRGHHWVTGGLHHKSGCQSCGGVALVTAPAQTDAVARFSGVGDSSQSTAFYAGAPTLDPALEIIQIAAPAK